MFHATHYWQKYNGKNMKITLENTPIFVMHCKLLKERRINIDVQMKKYNLMPKLICDWDASELESDIRFSTSFYKYDEQLWHDRIRWQGDFLNFVLTGFWNFLPPVNIFEKHSPYKI